MGCLQRLPHGRDRGEHRQAIRHLAASSRTNSRPPRSKRPKPRRRRDASRTRSRRSSSSVAQGHDHFDTDEYIRAGTTRRIAARSSSPHSARTARSRPGNASGINDGAAAVMMMSARKADGARARRRWRRCALIRPRASIRKSWAWVRCRRAGCVCRRRDGRTQDLDLMEINEAFAAQAIAVNRQMELGHRARSTSTAAPSPSAIRSARPVAGSW